VNYAADHFLRHLPIVYCAYSCGANDERKSAVRGLFIGDDLNVSASREPRFRLILKY
jgi:hypothetical protein